MRLYLVLSFLLCLPWTVHAAEPHVLLDAELQSWLEDLAKPLLKAADIPADSIHLHILLDDEVNAFATPGNHIFFYSGLILRADSVAEVRGVLAHELGHIQSQHLFQRYDDIASARFSMLAGALLGLGAAVAGSPDGAIAGLMSGQALGVSNLLRHSRTQEREADSYAVNTLHNSGYSMDGMVSFFKKLRNDSLMTYDTPPAHLLTHPLPAERLDALVHQADEEKQEPALEDVNLEEDHHFAQLQAKLYAFTHSPPQTLRRYRGTTTADQVAQTLAYLYQGRFPQANQHLSALLKAQPNNPFFYELGGHIALDGGNMALAEKAFAEALRLREDLPLVRYHYARALQGINKQKEAVTQLRIVEHALPDWPSVWYALGTNLGQLGQLAESHLALAEYHLQLGDLDSTRQQLALADQQLKESADKRLKAHRATLQAALDRAEEDK